ncbi:MAG: UDP-glucose/GDP-mannose dehydrogenase family protein [Gammaproteobacteria bacterium]|nr:UDP-glucose/GDP-mannose dehydrogenase family protein [Gammaproteobacteria bacterium]MDH5239220.1 UDP-glucose/GDP-mannose dehydrogenase family protein [Gammaproteobacteria bacterium]MDH5259914.1 UDP-glucose/GDP-mannose dehydrogenase family protein [Gammaproteobacteria bacterium]
MRISIFGLGYVGAVSLACLARDGHHVVGVDIDKSKLDLIGGGKAPIVEEGIIELVRDVVASGRVEVTSDPNVAVRETELSFVCVGTPSLPNGDQDLSAMVRLAEQIGVALMFKSSFHTIVIRSTVQPGTVEKRIIPLIEKNSGKKSGLDFAVCFQPEFLREGSSIKDYDNPPMTVVGTRDQRAVAQLRSLFGGLPCKFIETDIRVAESLKYACNAFHALKITFANEIGRFCQALGTDGREVMALLCEDEHLNISRAYLRPGFAFGGSCLPKDLRALLYMAKIADVELPMLSGVLPSNRTHVNSAVDRVLSQGGKSVGIIGLSFKSGTDDLRESPMVELVERLIGKGLKLKIYDPEVQISRLIGANKRYIEEVVPHIGDLMCDRVDEVIRGADAVVVGLLTEEVLSELHRINAPNQYILDIAGIKDAMSLNAQYQGVCW